MERLRAAEKYVRFDLAVFFSAKYLFIAAPPRKRNIFYMRNTRMARVQLVKRMHLLLDMRIVKHWMGRSCECGVAIKLASWTSQARNGVFN